MPDTVKLKYESSHNISFTGEIDTEISRDDWNAMSEDKKIDFMTDQLWQLVDIYESDGNDE